MRAFLLVLILLSFSLSDNTCEGNTVYVKFLMKTGVFGSQNESFEIYDGASLLYTSPVFESNTLREWEHCLQATVNNQYTLQMKHAWESTWISGSYLTIQGVSGNRVFKNYMTKNGVESFSLSLYYAVNMNDQWKITWSTVSGTWTENPYNDNDWTTVTLGSVSAAVTGPQYFRKQFTGLANMAAYEVSFLYKYGLVAYIDGVEIFRDNMPSGPVTPTTYSSGGYITPGYHAIIRPGVEVASSSSVLAVEIHWMENSDQTYVDFNAYLAILASSSSDGDSCFIYPYDITLSSTSGDNVNYSFDFAPQTSFTLPTANLPTTISYTMAGARPFINGIRIYPNTYVEYSPRTFTLEASSAAVGPWTQILRGEDVIYQEDTHFVKNGYFNSNLYSYYRLTIESGYSSSLRVYEIQPVVCSISPPSIIEFSQASYSFYAKFEDFSIRPLLNEFTNCNINPTPLTGMTFDSATCTISGKVMNPSGPTTFTLSSVVNGVTYQGSIQISIVECDGTLVNVVRTYKSNAIAESFDIKKASNQEVVLSVTENSGQVNNKDWSSLLCLSTEKYIITPSTSNLYWSSGSHIYINAILDGFNDYETIIRARHDSNLGLPASYTFDVDYAIDPYSTWSYKMGEVPTNWYNSETSGWSTASHGSFPDSTNQIQLYKKTFSVSSVTDVAGFVISLRYQYGVLIYLNNHEVFRLGFTGDLSTSTYSDVNFGDTNYREISLPIKSISLNGTASVDYITTGSNTIAIALIAQNPTMKTSSFDCALRLMGVPSVSRSFDVTSTGTSVSGSFRTIFNQYCGDNFYANCGSNSLEVEFNDHRHEWISSVIIGLSYSQLDKHPKYFVIKAKNEDEEEWTTLANVENLAWSIMGQHNRIWLPTNKAYNKFRFEDFATGDPNNCRFQVGFMDLRADATTITVPPLAYEATEISIYKDIEMGEVYPTTTYYRDFTVTPALPTGVTVDKYTGTISGTAHDLESSAVYTISAVSFTGVPSSTTVSLSVNICHGGKSLITLVVRTDSRPAESSYKIFEGKTTEGTPVHSVEKFILSSGIVYGDFCLPHSIYTVNILDTENGWSYPAGYYMTVDVGEMKFEMGQVYDGGNKPVSIATYFSSYLPFQIQYSEWKVLLNTAEAPANWNTINFDDSTWSTVKANAIGTSQSTTVYIRKDIPIVNVTDYQVLNVRVKYTGGVVAYFNGRKVARFNLEEDFDSTSESLIIHDANTFSKFHIVLPTVGITAGMNIIAFELHRPIGQSSSEPIVFDATGVFGVNDCSIGVDSFFDISGTNSGITGGLPSFFDLTPVTYGSLTNAIGTYLQWSVENLEGSKFNSFAFEPVYTRTGLGFAINGRTDREEDMSEIYLGTGLKVNERKRTAFSVPVGIAGYRHFKWEITAKASSSVYVSAFIFQYCKASGSGVCEGVDDYPAVAEGEISPGACQDGYYGYSYRECSEGAFGEIKYDKCHQKLPDKLRYEQQIFTLVKDTSITIAAPHYVNIITHFHLDENVNLPTGLTLDEVTGAITGIPTEVMDIKSFTIYGENETGVTSTEISILIRVGECKAEGNFPKTTVGNTAVYECSAGGSYIGTQKRACVLGAKDGEWQQLQGICVLIPLLIVVIAIVIIVVVIVVYFVMRVSRRKKAVGGVKGKKKSAPTKTEKKPATKDVKV